MIIDDNLDKGIFLKISAYFKNVMSTIFENVPK